MVPTLPRQRTAIVSSQRTRRRRRGFTLAELMVVVLIMGILAAVGLTSFTQHVNHSKHTQALAVCQSIAYAQQRFFTLNSYYLDVASGDLNELYPTDDPGLEVYNFWGHSSAVTPTTYANWLRLGPVVPVYTRYAFSVVAGLPDDGSGSVTWPALGTVAAPSWPTTVNDPWYIIKAVGDVDADDNNSTIIMSSFSSKIYMEFVGE